MTAGGSIPLLTGGFGFPSRFAAGPVFPREAVSLHKPHWYDTPSACGTPSALGMRHGPLVRTDTSPAMAAGARLTEATLNSWALAASGKSYPGNTPLPPQPAALGTAAAIRCTSASVPALQPPALGTAACLQGPPRMVLRSTRKSSEVSAVDSGSVLALQGAVGTAACLQGPHRMVLRSTRRSSEMSAVETGNAAVKKHCTVPTGRATSQPVSFPVLQLEKARVPHRCMVLKVAGMGKNIETGKRMTEVEAMQAHLDATAGVRSVVMKGSEEWSRLSDKDRLACERLRRQHKTLEHLESPAVGRGHGPPAVIRSAILATVRGTKSECAEPTLESVDYLRNRLQHCHGGRKQRRSAPMCVVDGGLRTWDECLEAGGTFPVRWCVLRAQAGETATLMHQVADAAYDEIPQRIFPTNDDTPATHAGRTGNHPYLDHLVENYPRRRFHVNSASAGTFRPYRITMSVVATPEHKYEGDDGDGHGEYVAGLFSYTSFGRETSNWKCRPMTHGVWRLGLVAWLVAWPHLSEVSQESPPTGMQALLYPCTRRPLPRGGPPGNHMKGSYMGHHRDNFDIEDLLDSFDGIAPNFAKGHASGGEQNSQAEGSSVMVVSMGNRSQEFALHFPPADDVMESTRSETGYKVRFCFNLGKYSICVLDPIDDVRYTHGLTYPDKHTEPEWCRVAFVFRWLQSEQTFYTRREGVDRYGMRQNARQVRKQLG